MSVARTSGRSGGNLAGNTSAVRTRSARRHLRVVRPVERASWPAERGSRAPGSPGWAAVELPAPVPARREAEWSIRAAPVPPVRRLRRAPVYRPPAVSRPAERVIPVLTRIDAAAPLGAPGVTDLAGALDAPGAIGAVRPGRTPASRSRQPNRARRRPPPPLRLTRRGRLLARALLILAALITAIGVAAATQAAGTGSESRGPRPSMVVRQGDTLWNIADRYAPGSGRQAAMNEIRRLNHLRDSKVEVGQKLLLPYR